MGFGNFGALNLKRNRDARLVMIKLGFDFSLIGSIYIYEMFNEILVNKGAKKEEIPSMTALAEKHNQKLKSISRNIRWAIEKACKSGSLGTVPFLEGIEISPSTKQVLSWLFYYYTYQQQLQNANANM